MSTLTNQRPWIKTVYSFSTNWSLVIDIFFISLPSSHSCIDTDHCPCHILACSQSDIKSLPGHNHNRHIPSLSWMTIQRNHLYIPHTFHHQLPLCKHTAHPAGHKCQSFQLFHFYCSYRPHILFKVISEERSLNGHLTHSLTYSLTPNLEMLSHLNKVCWITFVYHSFLTHYLPDFRVKLTKTAQDPCLPL